MIKPVEIEDLPIWVAVWIECVICSKRHVSVHIVGMERVECPGCGYMTPVVS